MLIDCTDPVGSELFIVEGKNAAHAVKRVRSRKSQAILALQGKLPNAARTKTKKINDNPHVNELLLAVGSASDCFKVENQRYSKIIILTDPDADGVHARALVMIYFYYYLRSIIQHGVLHAIHAPLYSIKSNQLSTPQYAYTLKNYQQLTARLRAAGIHDQQATRYKGIASLDADSLARVCVEPESRTIGLLSETDCAAMVTAFGGAASP